MAGIATSLWSWHPEQFWQSTPTEFWMAWASWCKAHGIEVSSERALNGEEMQDLLSRFPD